MKTPEQVAQEIVAGWQRELVGVMLTKRVPNGPTFAEQIADALAAERQRADALAGALRDYATLAPLDLKSASEIQRDLKAILAAYDAEAK